ncbi:MAG: hypothetical protein QME79_12570 [Bacillota bacterium]|nr:hypothetical protein [Bacillota bacterium]
MSVKLVKVNGAEHTFPETFRVEGWPSESAIPSLTVEGRQGAVVDDADIVERERTITVSGTLYADTATGLQAAYDTLAAFVNSQPRKMRLYADETEERFFWVRKQTLSHRFVRRSGRTLAEVSIVFRASDPFMYGPLHRMPLIYPMRFSRNSVAYKQDGSQVASGVPRYETGQFGQALMVEEGTTNLIINPFFTNWSGAIPDNWVYSASTDQVAKIAGSFGPNAVKITSTGDAQLKQTVTGITAGATYAISVRSRGGTTATRFCFFLTWQDSGGGALSSIYPLLPIGLASVESSVKTTTVTAPANAARLSFGIWTHTTSGDPAIIEGVQLEAKPFPTSITGGTRSPETLTIPTPGVLADRGPWTVEGWFQTQHAGGNHRMPFGAWTKFYVSLDPSDKPVLSWINASSVQQLRYAANPLANPTARHYWAMAWDGATVEIQVDDQIVISATCDLPQPLPANLYVGQGGAGSQYTWDGLVDDFRVSSVWRSYAERLAAYQSGQPLPVDRYTTCKLNFDGNLNLRLAQPGNVEGQQPLVFIKARSGVLVNPSLTLGGKALTYTGTIPQGKALLADAERMLAIITDGSLDYYLNQFGLTATPGTAPTSETSVLGAMNADWLKDGWRLPLGESEVVYSDDATSSHNADVKVVWEPRYW